MRHFKSCTLTPPHSLHSQCQNRASERDSRITFLSPSEHTLIGRRACSNKGSRAAACVHGYSPGGLLGEVCGFIFGYFGSGTGLPSRNASSFSSAPSVRNVRIMVICPSGVCRISNGARPFSSLWITRSGFPFLSATNSGFTDGAGVGSAEICDTGDGG